MSTLPAISVVIPAYNASSFLPTTLRSVLSQEGFELDVIVVDDGSSDDTAASIRKGYPQVRLLQQSNAGVAAARNHGLAQAQHEWVAFVDADDVWLPGKLQAQWAQLQRQPEAQMGYTAWRVWHTDDIEPAADLLLDVVQAGLAGDAAQHFAGASGWIYPELLADCVVWTSTVLARRSLLLDLGGFDAGLRIGEDYDLWLRASRLTPILRVPRPLALYRHHGSNITHRVPERNFKGEVVGRALARWGYTGPDGRQADRRLVDAGLARSWADFAGARLIEGQTQAARRAAWQALLLDRRQWLAWSVLAKSCLTPGRTA
ncbi:glycosyltransferase [Ideonella sp. DXS22W]|uniref:Glycosyltransferase n=1 Tax=Pseudaquabacterium inlustre TaxID=2984192 RepID=A0ABU9CQ97_9BURK